MSISKTVSKPLCCRIQVKQVVAALLGGLIVQPLSVPNAQYLGWAPWLSVSPVAAQTSFHPDHPGQNIPAKTQNIPEKTTTPTTEQDPLRSPYPIPWSPIWEHQAKASSSGQPITWHYTSPPLQSPDGQLQAISKIEVYLQPDFRESHILSQVWVKNQAGQTVETVLSSMHLGESRVSETAARHLPGTVSMLVPAAWSDDSQHLLLRQFEALFGSDIASDYGIVWDRSQGSTRTFAPEPINYDTATLLGWSRNHPDQVLFSTSIMGDSREQLLAVNFQGHTVASPGDRPLIVQQTQHIQTKDPQARR